MREKYILVIAIYILVMAGIFYIVRCNCASSALIKGDYLVSCAECKCLYQAGSGRISLFKRGGQLICPVCSVCKLKE